MERDLADFSSSDDEPTQTGANDVAVPIVTAPVAVTPSLRQNLNSANPPRYAAIFPRSVAVGPAPPPPVYTAYDTNTNGVDVVGESFFRMFGNLTMNILAFFRGF